MMNEEMAPAIHHDGSMKWHPPMMNHEEGNRKKDAIHAEINSFSTCPPSLIKMMYIIYMSKHFATLLYIIDLQKRRSSAVNPTPP